MSPVLTLQEIVQGQWIERLVALENGSLGLAKRRKDNDIYVLVVRYDPPNNPKTTAKPISVA